MKNLFIALLFCASFTRLTAQNDTIKNLVFEGAGLKGIAYSGVMKQLHQLNKLDHLEKVGGTSAGAIIALAVSLGYTSEQVDSIIFNTKFNKFNNGFLGFRRTIKRFGYYKGKKVDQWIGKIIEGKTKNANITFKELQEQDFLNLYTVATLLDQQRLEVYSVEKYPNMKVRDAVRASMSIPIYFEAMFIDDQGKTYKKLEDSDSAHVVSDGGVIGNFPIFIFDEVINDVRIPNPYTLGIRIDQDNQILYDRKRKGLAPFKINSFKHFVAAFYEITIETANRSNLTDADWARTVSVSSGEVGAKIKKLKKWEKDQLINNGVKGVNDYYNKKKT